MEYVAAKSSMCRQCGRYFPPFAPKAGLKLHVKEEAPVPENPSIRHKLEDFWKRQRTLIIECFECQRKQQVCSTATSTICPGCSAHIDLRDYRIDASFTANASRVEKGGIFAGQLGIGQADVTQGELLPERKPAAASTAEPDISGAAPQPLPAT